MEKPKGTLQEDKSAGSEGQRLATISPTAVAGLLSYAACGIPLAKEFLDLIRNDWMSNPPRSIFNPSGEIPLEDLIRREIHCRAIDGVMRKFLAEGRADTVLEFAAGVSPKGLSIVKDYVVTYIETDVSDDFAKKAALCNRVVEAQGLKLKGRQLFYRLDAITMEGMEDVRKELEPGKPIILVNAGLMTYHPPDKREQIALNVMDIMRSAPGSVWVTPDIGFMNLEYWGSVTKLSATYAQHWATVKADFRERLGIDIDRDFYRNETQATEHFAGLGFKIEKFGQPELGFSLHSAPSLQLDSPAREEFLSLLQNSIKVWVLQLGAGSSA